MAEAGFNAARALLEPHLANGREAHTAFIDPTGRLTYGQLERNVNAFGHLLASFGIVRETRVALLMHDTLAWPVSFLGAIAAGAVPVALNTLLTGEQYRYILNDSRAKALFVSAALLPVIEPILRDLPHLTHVFVAGGEAPSYAVSLEQALTGQPTHAVAVDTHRDETAFWLYSSGSTGMPKGTRHLHTSMAATADLFGRQVLGLTGDDVVLSAAKLFFAYGLGNALSFPLAVGATTILHPGRPTPDDMFALLARHNVSVFFGVPTLYAAMLAHREQALAEGIACASHHEGANAAVAASRALPALRFGVSAGEALPADVGESFKAQFGVDLIDGVGSTEMLHIYVSNRPDDIRYGTSGKPVPGYRIRLVDEEGADVPDGEVGEMIVEGPSAADGYWNQRAKSRATFQGTWTRSGDKYTRDAEGYFTYAGRTDDMFKVSGIWVSPFEVESALVSHPDVLEAAVVPATDEEGLLKPKAFVVLKEGAGEDGLEANLKEQVKARAGPWKYPRWIVFAPDLPKTATGKIQRFKLREL
ncbi:MAG: benzoate-CoA ligase family protein [Pseudomonadota bacterium]